MFQILHAKNKFKPKISKKNVFYFVVGLLFVGLFLVRFCILLFI